MKFRAILSSKAHPGCRQATKAVQDCGTSVVAVTVQDQHSTMTLQLPADSLAGCRGHVDWAATGTEDRWRFWEAIGLRPPSAKRCCLSPPVARDFRVGELAYRKKYLDNPTVQSFNNGSAEWFKSIDRGKSWGWKGSGPWNTTDICSAEMTL